LLFVCCAATGLYAQTLKVIGTSLNLKSYDEEMSRYFLDYELVQPNYSLTPSQLQNHQEVSLDLQLGQLQASISLTRNTILSSRYQVTGTVRSSTNSLPLTFTGNIRKDATSRIHLSLVNGDLFGLVESQGITYWIESARKFDESLPKHTLIIYKESDVITSKKQFCASHEVVQRITDVKPRTTKTADCKLVELAIALDYSYVTKHGGVNGAIEQSTAIMDLVATNYQSSFASDIRFEIVEHYLETSVGQNTWGTSIQASVLLNAFTSWAPSGFSSTHDLGQLWSGENIWENNAQGQPSSGIAGLAWVGSACGNNRYHILEDYTSTAWALRVLTSHEMGHNFGAGHDSGAGDIMAGTISQNTNSWSTGSINSINSMLDGYTCMSECLLGSCSEISNVRTSDCTPGNSSTYTLSFDLAHGGGGNSDRFEVNVDGETFEFQWEGSNQTIIIENLEANGTQNTIVINALDGSDTGCQGEAVYDEPTDDCSFREIVNFNNCTIPNGWSSATTQGSIINGGDPMVQYQWKYLDANRTIANYDIGPNASSLLSIDGSCMAIMDDDIFSVYWYSGVVTLTSAEYDLNGYDEVVVSFDYNFHAFEDDKSTNNSYFQVQAWNGSSYINILMDSESSCPWSDAWQPSCNNHFQMNVTEHANADMHFRFIYSDGNDGAWAGMASFDNFELSGTVSPSNECQDEIILSHTIEEALSITSPEVEFEPGFEVMLGVEFSIVSQGCATQ